MTKLLLVSPSRKVGKWIRVPKALKIPQLGLHILASLTPNDVDITIVDEEIREIDASLDFDLVGISCMTATANKSYQLSDRFRQRGSKVVLGGFILLSYRKNGDPAEFGRSFRIDSGHVFRRNPDTLVGAKRRWTFFDILLIPQVVSSFCFFRIDPPFS